VRAAERGVSEKLDREFFMTRYEKATPAERRYMAAAASLGDGPQRSAAVAQAMGSRSQLQSLNRDALIRKGLMYSPRHGTIDFTVPHFADFMRRQHPV
jgi:hypothetical protein